MSRVKLFGSGVPVLVAMVVGLAASPALGRECRPDEPQDPTVCSPIQPGGGGGGGEDDEDNCQKLLKRLRESQNHLAEDQAILGALQQQQDQGFDPGGPAESPNPSYGEQIASYEGFVAEDRAAVRDALAAAKAAKCLPKGKCKDLAAALRRAQNHLVGDRAILKMLKQQRSQGYLPGGPAESPNPSYDEQIIKQKGFVQDDRADLKEAKKKFKDADC